MGTIGEKTTGSFQLEHGLGSLAGDLISRNGGSDFELSLPAELVAAAKSSEPDDPSCRPDLLDALLAAVAFGHAFALARLEEPFATEGDWLAAARTEGLIALLRHYGVEEEVA